MAAEATVPTAARPDLALVGRWWRAASYIYLMDNPLLREPLPAEVAEWMWRG